MSGLEPSGFVPKSQQEILAEINESQRSSIDPNLNNGAESLLGEVNGIVSAKLAELWELGEAIYKARSPTDASNFSLDNLAAITGTLRDPARKGTVTLTVTLAALTTLPAGAVAAVSGQPTNRWVTLDDAVNSSGSPASVDVEAEASATGVIPANAGTITVIATPTAGWSAVTNALDAEVGADVEQDPSLRTRREEELDRPGTSPVDAVRADILTVDGVTYCRVLENTTDTTSDGIPPHNIEAIVRDGDSAEIALQLWRSKAAGIGTHGNITEIVKDSQGFDRTVKFRRPTDVNIYVQVVKTVNSAIYAGDAALKEAITLKGSELYNVGDKVFASGFYGAALGVKGVIDCTITVGFTAPGLVSSLVLATRELARFDTTRVTVV